MVTVCALQYIFPFRPTKLVIHRRKRRKRIWRFSAEVNYWNCFTFTTWFYKLISQNISILTVFGMSKTSLYYPQLFWLILEEEPNWKNFKTLPDATCFLKMNHETSFFFLTESRTLTSVNSSYIVHLTQLIHLLDFSEHMILM